MTLPIMNEKMPDIESSFNHLDPCLLIAANRRLSQELLRAQNDLKLAEKTLECLSRKAKHDELTGLPNRALLTDRFTQAAACAHRNGHRMALLFLDIDHFKVINDTHGHQVGDWALKRTANYLISAVREGDTVSRHGGDEFLILLSEIVHVSDAELTARKIALVLEQAADGDALQPGLSASIGISIYPDDGTVLGQLTHLADMLMHRSKIQRREKLTHQGVPADRLIR